MIANEACRAREVHGCPANDRGCDGWLLDLDDEVPGENAGGVEVQPVVATLEETTVFTNKATSGEQAPLLDVGGVGTDRWNYRMRGDQDAVPARRIRKPQCQRLD